ncbi:MAG: signal peptidase I [Patescibacteria group bacterium]|nr:signal peptidase I [Patescibacteria group bacterium]
MNKKTKSIVETLIYIIIMIVLAVGTPKALCYILKTEHPVASITSGSMWPALKKGDLVLIAGVDKSELEVGDIIVYENSIKSKQVEAFTIHRIVELNEESLKTRGDANNISDKPIKYEKVVGKMVNVFGKPLRIPKLGKVTIWASGLGKRD